MYDYKLFEQQQHALGLTNRDIAVSTGLTESTVSRLIHGKTKDPGFDEVCLLCDLMDIPLDRVAGRAYLPVQDENISSSFSDLDGARLLDSARRFMLQEYVHLAQANARSDGAVKSYRNLIAVVLTVSLLLNMLFLCFVVIDALRPGIGWFR